MLKTLPWFKGLLDSFSALRQEFTETPRYRHIILCVLAIDATLLLLHFIHTALIKFQIDPLFFSNPNFSLYKDRGYPEIYLYIKVTGVLVILAAILKSTGQRVYLSWFFVYAFVLADDSLGIHESVGSQLVERFDLPALTGLRPQDTGELLVWGSAGSVLAVLLLWGFWRSGPVHVGFGLVIAACFAGLAFFAIVVDMFQVTVEHTPSAVRHAVRTLEDAGELLSMTVAFTCVLLIYGRTRAIPERREASGRSGTAPGPLL